MTIRTFNWKYFTLSLIGLIICVVIAFATTPLGWAVAIYFGVSVTMDAVRTFILIKDHVKTRTTS